MKDLSIIIVSYNTADLTRQCLFSIAASLKEHPVKTEIILVDNNSSDESRSMIQKLKESKQSGLILIENKENVGFGKANNIGLRQASGKYILFLNSDTVIQNVDLNELLSFMDKDEKIGVLTVRVNLENGTIDPASHRGFPTIWRSFTYFTKLEHLTRGIPVLNRVFGGYHLTHLDIKNTHEIDSASGAFYLTRKKILDEVHGFDEDYFMYGEDLDLSKRIKERGYKVVFYPSQSITHLKGRSGMKHDRQEVKKQTNKHFYEAMKIFYDKHYKKTNPSLLNTFIHWMIDLKSK